MNLLPNQEKDFLKKGFKTRFIIVSNIILAASILVGGVLLLPSYFLTKGHLAFITSLNSFTRNEDEELTKNTLQIPTEISSKLKFVDEDSRNLRAGESFSKIISYLPEKVRLNSISFDRQGEKNKKGTLFVLSGIAEDRESLVSFEALLRESNSFSEIDVPVSSLTKEGDLPFSMKILIEE